MKNSNFRVFVLEDDKVTQQKIAEELKEYNYKIQFFPKDESVFDLLKFNPDILIQDYKKNIVIRCYEWETSAGW